MGFILTFARKFIMLHNLQKTDGEDIYKKNITLGMKKISLMLGAMLVVVSASAEGYQVNTLSARQLGMGHVMIVHKLTCPNAMRLKSSFGGRLLSTKWEIGRAHV